MIPSEFSELKVYSIGIVAANKKLGSRIVEVTPVEDLTMLHGEINSDIHNEKIVSTDRAGAEYQVNTDTTNSIPATWLPIGSANRFTPPDVRRGERVVLYRFADKNKFYWTTLFDDLKLRKLETAIYAWSGTKDENVTAVTPENYYFLEVSTHKGLINFHTSQANGEFCSYDVQINTKDGFLRIEDNVGQFIILDSKEKQIAMKNADDCYFEINKKNMTLNVPETYTLKAKNVIEEIAEKITTKSGTSIEETTGTFKAKTSGTYTLETGGAYSAKSSATYKIDAAALITIKGMPVQISKNVALT